MNERYKEITRKLSDFLWQETLQFMAHNLEKEEDTSDLINLILSSYLSSLCNLMKWLSQENPPMNEKVKEFIDGLLKHVAQAHPIKDMEVINNERT